MTELELLKAVGGVGDDLIARADVPAVKNRQPRVLQFAALAACCCLIVGTALAVGLGRSRKGVGSTEAADSTQTAAMQNYAADSAVMDIAPAEAGMMTMMQSTKAESVMEDAALPEAEAAVTEEAEVKTEATLKRVVEFGGKRYVPVDASAQPPAEPGEHLGTLPDGREVYACEEDFLWIGDDEGLYLYQEEK